MAFKIFSGSNGYYISAERPDGSHYQPDDNGAILGWDEDAARRELRRQLNNANHLESERKLRLLEQKYRHAYARSSPDTRAYLDHVYPLDDAAQEDESWLRCAIRAATEGRTLT